MDTTGFLSVETVATRLGRSGQTVRRMHKRGELRGVLVVTPKGKALLIDPDSLPRVEGEQQSAPLIDNTALTPLAPEASPVVDLIRELTAEVARLSVENGRLQEKVATLEAPRKRRWWRW